MGIFIPRVAIEAIATLGLYPFARSGAKDGCRYETRTAFDFRYATQDTDRIQAYAETVFEIEDVMRLDCSIMLAGALRFF